MTEIDNFILSKTNVTEQTKRNYRTQYKSIVSILGKPILDANESEIINAVHQLANGNYSSEWTYMNIPFMVRAFNGLNNELINKRREDLKGLREFHTNISKSQKQDALPQMKEIQNYIKELFNNKKYKSFIVNYLISNYGVRNKDVDDDDNIYTIKKYIYEKYKLNYEDYNFYDSDNDDEEYNFFNEIELKIIKNYNDEWETYRYCEILTFVEFCDFYNEDYEVMRQNIFFQSKAIKKHFGF